MTQKELKTIIGMIEAFPDVFQRYVIGNDFVHAVNMENVPTPYNNPEQVRQDILEYLYGVPKGTI